MPSPRRVVVVAFPDVQALDVTGPMEVFSLADRESARAEYEIELVAGDGAAISTSSGLQLIPARSLQA